MHSVSATECALLFTEEEETKFTRRYENGYDLVCDPRYNQWLSIHVCCLNLTVLLNVLILILHLIGISIPKKKLGDFLQMPPPPTKKATKVQETGRVLTSLDHIKMLEDKLKKKQEEAEMKEKRKRERLQKKADKEQERAQKKLKKGLCVILFSFCTCNICSFKGWNRNL